MNIRITKMTSKFADEIADLGRTAKELQIDSNSSMYYSADTLKKLIKNQSGICLVALDGDKLAGFAVRTYHDYFNEVYLSDLFVKEEYRKLGIGKQLFDESIRIAKLRGVDWAWALVQTENERMQMFLEKNGFKKGKAFYFYYKDGI